MLTTRQGVHVLATPDLTDFLALAAQDPVVNVFAEYRARTTNLEPPLARRRDVGPLRRRPSWSRPATSAPTWCRCRPAPDDVAAFAERALTRGATVLDHRRPAGRGRGLWAGLARGLGPAARDALATSRTW